MKLALYLKDEQSQQALKYYSLKSFSSVQIYGKYSQAFSDVSELVVLQNFSMLDIGLQASPRLEVSERFGILCISPESSPPEGILGELLKSKQLYVLEKDLQVLAFLKGYKYEAVDLLTNFYRQSNPLKLIVTTQPEIVNCIISSNPEGFFHFILAKDDIKLCLGGEYWNDDPTALRSAVHLAEELCQNWVDKSQIPYLEARQCLIDGGGAYGFFADRYDSYMAHVDYELWVERLKLWHRVYSNGNLKRILELACGTANVASRFVKAGYEVDACDLSAQMLVNAERKRYRPNLYQASLTDPIPGKDYDLIMCLFDSINYLNNRSQISQCLIEVEKALAPQGIFIFDISTLLNSMENFSELVNHQLDNDAHFIHKAYYEPGHRLQVSKLYLFKAQGAAYSLHTEEHHQRVYMTEELIQIIADSPLELLAIHSTESKTNFYPKKLSGLDHRYYRLFFVLGKA